MNSSAIALPEPPRGDPSGGIGVQGNGFFFRSLAPINLFTGILVTHTDQRRAKKILPVDLGEDVFMESPDRIQKV